MKLKAGAGRRLVIGVSVACAAVLLPVTALAASAASGAPARPAAAPCNGASTTAWIGLPANGTAGTSFYELEISNIGHHACTFFGYPGVSTLDIHGHQIGRPARHSGAKSLVTLQPGGTSHVVLGVTDAGAVCAHPVHTVLLRVFAPGQFHSKLVPLPLEACRHRSTIRVDAIHPGAGIPFSSIR